jgi:hypothetical protein
MALFLLGTFYAAMVTAGYVVELVFGGLIRFVRTGGVAMLRMMGGSPDRHDHDHMDAHASHSH